MTLRPHQRDALRAISGKSSAGIFLEMRLGKTLVAIRWACSRPRAKTVLVLAPYPAVSSWIEQLAMDGVSDEMVFRAAGLGAKKTEQMLFDAFSTREKFWFVANYEAASKSLSKEQVRKRGKGVKATSNRISRFPWDVVILDESPKIRKPTSTISKIALNLLIDAPHRACLSGLPHPEGPIDFVCQGIFLNGRESRFMGCRNYYSWLHRYTKKTNSGPKIGRTVKDRIAAEARKIGIFLRKEDVGMVDEMVREVRTVQLPRKVLAAAKQARKELRIGDRLTNHVLAALEWETQLAGGRYKDDPTFHHDRKYREVLYLLRTELRSEKVVIYASRNDDLRALADLLESRGIACPVVDGTVKDSDRDRVYEGLREGRFRAIACQPKAVYVGVDLSAASTQIHVSRWWDFDVNQQVEERNEKYGRTAPRLCIDIVAEDTVDEAIVAARSRKERTAGKFWRSVREELQERIQKWSS